MKPQVIAWGQIEKYIYNSRTLFVDLRDRPDFKKGHVAGAWNIPFEELESHADEFRRFGQVIFYCDKGNRSLMAAKRLARMGINTCSVFGGYEARNKRD